MREDDNVTPCWDQKVAAASRAAGGSRSGPTYSGKNYIGGWVVGEPCLNDRDKPYGKCTGSYYGSARDLAAVDRTISPKSLFISYYACE